MDSIEKGDFLTAGERDGMRPMYRMPVVFGPAAGPRNLPSDKEHLRHVKDTMSVSLACLSDRDYLSRLVPAGCEVPDNPVISVGFTYMTNIGWLAGRPYATAGVRIPVTYRGKDETISGNFLAVLWENHADPILTGREELGYSKLYCELPDARQMDGGMKCEARWDGFKFFELELSGLTEAPVTDLPAAPPLLHYKYIPRTGEWGESDIAQICVGKSSSSNFVEAHRRLTGTGKVKFFEASWEDMPTQYHITVGLANMPLLEFRGATVLYTSGGSDISEQRILR